jgi:microcystin degradation protein MlrC
VEQEREVITITVAGDFPYADIRDAEVSIVVTTDANPGLAQAKVRQMADQMWRRRLEFLISAVPVDKAVRKAIRSHGPVVPVDGAYNIGGGTPGDGTALLRETPGAGCTRSNCGHC